MASFVSLILVLGLVPSSLADCSVSVEYGDIQYCVKDTTPRSYAQFVDDCRLEDAEPFFPQNQQHMDFVKDNLLLERYVESTLWMGAYVKDGKIYSASSALIDISSLTFLTWRTPLSEVSAVTGFRPLQMNMEGEVFLAEEQDASLAICQKHLQNLSHNMHHKRNTDEADDTRCEPNWVYYNNKCYHFGSSKVTWPVANRTCSEVWASNLVVINNVQENHFLKTQLQANYVQGGGAAWIGLYKNTISSCYIGQKGYYSVFECRRQGWRWVGGQTSYASSYKNWNTYHPGGNHHRFVMLKRYGDWMSEVYLFVSPQGFICEKVATAAGANLVYVYIDYAISDNAAYDEPLTSSAANLRDKTKKNLYNFGLSKASNLQAVKVINIRVKSQDTVSVEYRFEGSPSDSMSDDQFKQAIDTAVQLNIDGGLPGMIGGFTVSTWTSSLQYPNPDNTAGDVGFLSGGGSSDSLRKDHVYAIVCGTLFAVLLSTIP